MTKPKAYLSKHHQEKRGLLPKADENMASLENIIIKPVTRINNGKKTEGIEEGFFANLSVNGQKQDFLEKSLRINDLYRELIGGHCYRYFSRGKVDVADVVIIDDIDNVVRLGSKIVEGFNAFGSYAANTADNILPKKNFRDPAYEERHPRVNSKGEMVVYSKELKQDVEIKGYITMLMIAKFIGDGDCIGPGPNAGYILKKDAAGKNYATCVKIDPGQSFTEEKKLHINHKFSGKHSHYRYAAFPPLLPNDPNFYNNKKLHDLYPNNYRNITIDSKDLLIDELSYKQIKESPNKKLYDEMALAAYDIANASEQELRYLVFGDEEKRKIPEIKASQLAQNKQPKYYSSNPVLNEKNSIFKMLKENQQCFKTIYEKEIAYGKELKHTKLQNGLKKYNVTIDQELNTRIILNFFIEAQKTTQGAAEYNKLIESSAENLLKANLKEDYINPKLSENIKAKREHFKTILDDQFKAIDKENSKSPVVEYISKLQKFMDNMMAMMGMYQLRAESKIKPHEKKAANEVSDHVARAILAHHKDKKALASK